MISKSQVQSVPIQNLDREVNQDHRKRIKSEKEMNNSLRKKLTNIFKSSMVSPKGQIRYDQTPSTLEILQIGMLLYLALNCLSYVQLILLYPIIYRLYRILYTHFTISKRSPQIQYSPVDEMESRGVKQGANFDDPKNEDSNSSISNILRSVLRDEPSYPTQESVRKRIIK